LGHFGLDAVRLSDLFILIYGCVFPRRLRKLPRGIVLLVWLRCSLERFCPIFLVALDPIGLPLVSVRLDRLSFLGGCLVDLSVIVFGAAFPILIFDFGGACYGSRNPAIAGVARHRALSGCTGLRFDL